MAKTVRLAIYFNDELRGIKEMKLPFVIGRSQDADLSVPHPMVSRRHCRIFEENDEIHLRDLGSLNGTFVGETRITHDVILNDNSSFSIGGIRFIVKANGVKEETTLSIDSDSAIGKRPSAESDDDLLSDILPSEVVVSQQNPPAETSPIISKELPSFDLNFDKGNGVDELLDVVDLDSEAPFSGKPS